MDIKETVMWLKIIRTNLKNFPEVSNSKKIEALSNAIDIAEAYESNKSDQDLVIGSAYKTGFKMGMLTGMADSVRDRV